MSVVHRLTNLHYINVAKVRLTAFIKHICIQRQEIDQLKVSRTLESTLQLNATQGLRSFCGSFKFQLHDSRSCTEIVYFRCISSRHNVMVRECV